MTQTTTDNGKTSFTVPTGDEIYDALMSDIDMDLITVNLPLLDAKYAGESTQERTARFKRYEEAYAKYDEAYAIWIQTLNQSVEQYRHEALRSAEAKDRVNDELALKALDLAMAA